MKLTIPDKYDPKLNIRQTQEAIEFIRLAFQKNFSYALNLKRISAPVFLLKSSGLNDNLNGVERPVAFDVPAVPGEILEVPQSLAKWKRKALKDYGFAAGEGLYTNMNAIRRDEEPDNLHSIYVDQWDWEKVISPEERNRAFLEETVRNIFRAIKATEADAACRFPGAVISLPDKIHFIDSEDLLQAYPSLSAKEREREAVREYGCVFLERIGEKLSDGKPHDGRAPDYDDWQLNGDILFDYPLLDCAFEVSSMGIRVNKESLLSQLKKSGCEDRLELPYHKSLVNGELPLTIGGGIGQSRLCMLLLGRAHIGEVQSGVWSSEMRRICAEHQIALL